MASGQCIAIEVHSHRQEFLYLNTIQLRNLQRSTTITTLSVIGKTGQLQELVPVRE